MTAIPLSRAFLCPDCSWICDTPDCCPKCGNCLGMLSIASVLNRAKDAPREAPEARGACGDARVTPYVYREAEAR